MCKRPVVACTVVIKPSTIPNSSWTTWQIIVGEKLDACMQVSDMEGNKVH